MATVTKTLQSMKLLYFDLETTGTDLNRHSIHQIAAIMEIDGVEVDRFSLPFAPHLKAELDPRALEVCNATEQGLRGRRHSYEEAYRGFERFLESHIDRYDKRDKAYLCGYNNRSFDDQFLRRFFEHNKNPYFGSWFWSDSWDTLVVASLYLRDRRAAMPNFQLRTVAAELGLEVEEAKLHDAHYDVELTRSIFKIVTQAEPSSELDLLA